MKFHVTFDRKKQAAGENAFSWVLKTDKGVPLAQSCKDYSQRSSCRTAIKNVIDGMAWAEIQAAPKGDSWAKTIS
jgi:uncharacterized protein YegP (UPF0339 family)